MAEKRDEPPGAFDFDEGDLAGAQTLPGALVCPVCNGMSTGQFCNGCGYELVPPTTPPTLFPPVGARIDGGGGRGVVLRVPLPSGPGAARFLGMDDELGRYEVLVTPKAADRERGVLARRTEARALLGGYALTPAWAADQGPLRYTVTRLPDAPSLADGLAALLADRHGADVVEGVRRWIVPLTAFLAGQHAEGRFFGLLDPAEILIDADGTLTFREPAHPREFSEAPLAPGRRRGPRGFTAPEVQGHCGGWLGPRTDVFFAGVSLYLALTRIAPLAEAGLSGERLPPPQVYAPDIPPALAAVARRATSPLPERRYPDARALHDALLAAVDNTLARRNVRPQKLQLDIGHELHVGVLKGQYSPLNQDDLFLAYDAPSGIGLFVIGDGVSISEYGSGDMASACVRAEAVDLWRTISGQNDLVDGTTDPGIAEAVTLPGLPRRPQLPDDRGRRRQLVVDMLDAANRRIADLVHSEMPRFPGPPEGIMASTAVGAIVDGNAVTLFSIGDSRAYLIRGGTIASLMIDDDLTTQLLRLGRAPSVARQVPAGGALIRCVGEFEKGDDERLIPVPLQPGFRELSVLPGDWLVLCSDGIPDYGGIDEEEAEENIRRAVESAPGAPWAAFELMVLANRGGGGDNISCIVLHFLSSAAMIVETDPALAVGGSAAP
jgi:serine/threonine protein phosphatase PrpC